MLVLIAVLLASVFIYNGLVRLREASEAAWSDIDVQLKRRYDLIPNLVETVKGYASHEQDTLEAVISARNRAMAAPGPAARAEAENMLSGALKSLFALSEAYPDLKAAGGFQDLQETLGDIEHHVSQSRRYYNAVVRDYNTKIAQVPSNLVAKTFGFRDKEFFEVADVERTVPRVSFGDDSALPGTLDG
jgi:LemA protein